jgi:hypothetical protein
LTHIPISFPPFPYLQPHFSALLKPVPCRKKYEALPKSEYVSARPRDISQKAITIGTPLSAAENETEVNSE